ncbi:MAG: hypothetical protein ABSA16_01780 [Thermoguttaceae bacterium]|jgi:hypothetical protein
MLLLAAPPLALVTNIVAVVLDKLKVYAIIGLAISALTCLLFFLLIAVSILCS